MKRARAATGGPAVLAGGTGLVGGHLLTGLLADEAWGPVVALGRREVAETHPKLSQVTVDFDLLSALADPGPFGREAGLPKGATFFCALGTTLARAGSKEAFRKVDLTYVAAVARLAAAMEARQLLLVSAVGADAGSFVFYNQVKGQAEAAAREAAGNGVAVRIFRPSLLLGERLEVRLAEKVGVLVGGALSFLFVGPLRHYKPVDAWDLARAMLGAAREEGTGVVTYEPEEIEELALRS